MLIEVIFKDSTTALFDAESVDINSSTIWFNETSYPFMDGMIADRDKIISIVLCSQAMTAREQESSKALAESGLPVAYLDLKNELQKVKYQLKKKKNGNRH